MSTQVDIRQEVTGLHTKQYGNYDVCLFCDNVLMASTPSGNFQLNPCCRCGKDVQTTGSCLEDDRVVTTMLS